MSGCEFDGRLQDLLDGALSPEEEIAVSTHLHGCDACAAAWDDLLALRAAAADLPAGFAPDHDLWSGIATRLAARPKRAMDRPVPSLRRGFGTSVGGRELAAAAVVALILLAGLQFRDGGNGAAYDELAAGYTVVREDCQARLMDENATLPRPARMAVNDGLDTLDRAIMETQTAIEKAASAPEQARRLVAGYHKKMDLLQRLTRLTAR